MKHLLILLLQCLVAIKGWTILDGMIVPDDDPQLQAAPPAGTKMSMAFATLTQAKEAYFSYILNIINQVQIDDITSGKAKAKGNSFWISEQSKDFTMMLTGETNTIQYVAGNVNAGFSTKDLSYDLGITTADGSLDANVTGMALAVNIELSWMLLANGRYSPSVHSTASNVVIPENGLNIDIKGDALVSFVSILKPLFMGIIHDCVVS